MRRTLPALLAALVFALCLTALSPAHAAAPTWRDTVAIPAGNTHMADVLDQLDPYYQLGRLPQPVTVSFYTPAPGEQANWSAQSSTTWVHINTTAFPTGGWEQALAHELVHVLDNQGVLTQTSRNTMLSLVKVQDFSGAYVTPRWGLDGSAPYVERVGEAFAEVVSRHIWYGLIKQQSNADLAAWGEVTYRVADIPTMAALLTAAPTTAPTTTTTAPVVATPPVVTAPLFVASPPPGPPSCSVAYPWQDWIWFIYRFFGLCA